MNTQTVTAAEQAVKNAEMQVERAKNALAEAKKRAEFESSFTTDHEVFILERRCIETGRLEAVLGVFFRRSEAERFAKGTKGYGLNRDMFINPMPFYS